MRNSSRHIVSKINWDLTFDKKEKIQDLQSKFGAWSKVDMLAEMNELFNGICPIDQTWKIDELEIDLGDLNYEDLEDELPKRFRLALYEKLVEMTYRSVRGDRKIQILDANSSLLELLSKYLISGYLPWNETGIISINELFLGQYRNNQQNLIERIKQLGKSERVRRRIAWQFNEASVKILIKEIEPNNYTEIFDFTDEFSKLQEKDSIVQTSTNEFRKTLWFWVLNHLFEERGTLFNRLAFMESTIEQMAQHYNLSFASLLLEIEIAVEKISKIYTLKSDFVKALHLISKRQSKRQLIVAQNQENNEYYFERLKSWFLENATVSNEITSTNANELLMRLAKSNPTQLKALLKSLPSENARVKKQISLLNSDTIQALTLLFAPSHGKELAVLFNHLREFSVKKGLSFRNWNTLLVRFLTIISEESNPVAAFFEELEKENQHETKKLVKLYYSENIQPQGVTEELKRIQPELFRSFITTIHQLNYTYSATNQLEKIDWFVNLFQHKLDRFGLKNHFFNPSQQNTPTFEFILSNQPEFLVKVLEELVKSKNGLSQFLIYLNNEQLTQLAKLPQLSKDKNLVNFAEVIDEVVEPLTYDVRRSISREYYHLFVPWGLKTPGNQSEMTWKKHVVVNLILFIERKHQNEAMFIASRLIRRADLEAPIAKWLIAYMEKSVVSMDLAGLSSQLDVLAKAGIDNKLLVKFILKNNHIADKNKLLNLNSSEALKIMSLLIPGLGNVYKKIAVDPSKFAQIKSTHLIDSHDVDAVFWKLLIDHKKHGFKLEVFLKNMKESLLKLVQSKEVRKLNYSEIVNEMEQKLKIQSKPEIDNKFSKELLFLLNTFDATSDSSFIQKSIQATMEKSSDELVQILIKTRLTSSNFAKIMQDVDLLVFSTQILTSRNTEKTEFLAVVEFLSVLVDRKGTNSINQKLQENAWNILFKIIQRQPGGLDSLKELVFTIARELSLQSGLKSSDILHIIRLKKTKLTSFLKTILIQLNPVFEAVEVPEKLTENSTYLQEILTGALGVELIEGCVFSNKLPLWFIPPRQISPKQVLKLILEENPYEFQQYLQKTSRLEEVIDKLCQIITRTSTKTWVKFLRTIGLNKEQLVVEIDSLFTFFGQISSENLKQVKKEVLFQILFRKTIMALKSGRWERLSPKILWQEIIWDATARYGANEQELIAELMGMNESLSVNLRMSLIQLMEQKKTSSNPLIESNQALLKRTDKIADNKSERPALLTEGISVNNAGLVLVNGYVKTLFDRLNLLEGNHFKNNEAVDHAVHYLQYVVNGLTHNEEHFLVLNKLICGLHPTQTVSDGLEISEASKTLIDGMIQAIINYWPAIGDCSINGFRGNWLIRDGILREESDRWNLIIEKRAYDILIQQAPFSFGIIKHPWMEKPIHVNWPY